MAEQEVDTSVVDALVAGYEEGERVAFKQYPYNLYLYHKNDGPHGSKMDEYPCHKCAIHDYDLDDCEYIHRCGPHGWFEDVSDE